MKSLPLIRKLGVTQAALKAAFSARQKPDKIQSLINRARDRIREAVNESIRDYRLYLAIDRALDSSFYQTSRTMFAGMLSGKSDSHQVLSQLKEWGYGGWIKDACGCGKSCSPIVSCPTPTKVVDVPAFFEVDFPISLAYSNIRLARIYNDRNLVPQFKFEPLVNTPKERLKNEIVTHRVQVQSQQLEYKSVLRQCIKQALSYSNCLLFPREAWWTDRQPAEEADANGKRKKEVKREGIRYEHPHPSRMYWDLAHPCYTLNSDTGCQFSGYWGLVRYGDVADNPDYWNRDKITFGDGSFKIFERATNFFATVYPCQIKFPKVADGISATDRQERLLSYTHEDRDSMVLFTNHFERLNPLRDLGLKNKKGEGYDGDVWFRLVIASDETVVYAEPLAYSPNVFFGYDPDANRVRVPSMVQELIPTQDMVGNLLTQAILQSKNNLININFYNTDVLDKSAIDQIQNLGEKRYRVPHMIPYSKHASMVLDNDRKDAVIPVPIQRMPISECLNLIRVVLDFAERSLVMSSQEIASTASHEQTAQEVVQTASSTSTRLQYTASGIDDAIFAWQRQLHDALMAYGDDVIFAEVALQTETDRDELKKLGFEVESENKETRTAGVRGKKQLLALDTFTMRRDAPDRVNSVAAAGAMTNFFQGFINNPMAIQIIGVDQFVQITNQILNAFQFQKDFRLVARGDPIKEAKEMAEKQQQQAQEQPQQAQQAQQAQQQAQDVVGQLQQILPQLEQKIIGEVGAQLKPVFEQAAQLDGQQQQQIDALGGGMQQLNAAVEKMAQILQAAMQPQVPPPMAAPPMPMVG